MTKAIGTDAQMASASRTERNARFKLMKETVKLQAERKKAKLRLKELEKQT